MSASSRASFNVEVLLNDTPVITSIACRRREGRGHAGRREAHRCGFQDAKARAIADFERAYITELLSRTQGNISQAARVSGKERSRLCKLVKNTGSSASRSARQQSAELTGICRSRADGNPCVVFLDPHLCEDATRSSRREVRSTKKNESLTG